MCPAAEDLIKWSFVSDHDNLRDHEEEVLIWLQKDEN